jgi:endonuclease/exonuclease/phosphatase (EEP) superfamily protein YafD
LLCLGGDRWWFATMMLFGPRWIYALPLAVLVPIVVLVRPRLLWLLAVAGAIVLGPVMGFCVPWPWERLFAAEGPTVRILTCNVQGGNHLDSEALPALIRRLRPDIVALQEYGGDTRMDWPPGWHVQKEGQLVVASRYPIPEVLPIRRCYPPSRWPSVNALCCVIRTPNQELIFCNVHLESPREGLTEVLDRNTLVSPSRAGALAAEIKIRWRESEDVARRIGDFFEPVIIAGDFNMPTDSAIYRRFWARFSNAFSTSGFGFGYTKRESVKGCHVGLRIDHVLTGPGWQPQGCWVGPDVGSDHLPVIAEFRWVGR